MAKSSPYRSIIMTVLPVFTLLLGWQIGVNAEQSNIPRVNDIFAESNTGALKGDPEKNVDMDVLWETWRILQNRYIDAQKLDTQAMVYGAATGLVKAVGDPYTVFMTPKENVGFHDALSGHLQGIGAELSDKDGQIVVVAPLKNSPAQKAGLLPNDVIVQVEGKDISGQTLDEVVSQVRGPKGTSVTLSVLRENVKDIMSFTITRDNITVPSTEYRVEKTKDGDVGYLAISQFGSETMDEAREILAGVDPTTLKGFIIDLRYNGGGYLDGAVQLVSMFQKSGKVVTVEGRGTAPQVQNVSGNPILPTIPLVVLQNQASASASEITAGALQDNKRATIIGMKSFGKGTVQEVVDLPGGSSLRVTIARWLTPSGRDLGKEGVKPDYVVDRTREDIDANRDPQLQAALQFLTIGKITEKTGTGSSVSSVR